MRKWRPPSLRSSAEQVTGPLLPRDQVCRFKIIDTYREKQEREGMHIQEYIYLPFSDHIRSEKEREVLQGEINEQQPEAAAGSEDEDEDLHPSGRGASDPATRCHRQQVNK